MPARCLALCLLLFAAGPLHAQPALYTTADLDTLVSCTAYGSAITGYGINLTGQVALACDEGVFSALYSPKTGKTVEIGGDSAPVGVNRGGAVAGQTYESLNGYLYSRGRLTTIGPPGTGWNVWGLNDSATVVGSATDPSDGCFSAFTWNNGIAVFLNAVLGAGGSAGFAINNWGDVVGTFSPGTCGSALGTGAFFLHRNGKLVRIGPVTSGQAQLRPTAVNKYDEVVGCEPNGSGAFLWVNPQLWDLGTLPDATGGCALAINNSGTIVGTAIDSAGSGTAWVWNGEMADLNTLIATTDPAYGAVHLASATSINDLGQILAPGTYTSGPRQGIATTLILTPAPATAARVAANN